MRHRNCLESVELEYIQQHLDYDARYIIVHIIDATFPIYVDDHSTVFGQWVEGHFEYFDGGYLQISWVAKTEFMLYHSPHQKVELLVQLEGGVCLEVRDEQ